MLACTESCVNFDNSCWPACGMWSVAHRKNHSFQRNLLTLTRQAWLDSPCKRDFVPGRACQCHVKKPRPNAESVVCVDRRCRQLVSSLGRLVQAASTMKSVGNQPFELTVAGFSKARIVQSILAVITAVRWHLQRAACPCCRAIEAASSCTMRT